jgi:acyl-CoA thioesterase-2
MAHDVAELLGVLDLEQVGTDHFRGLVPQLGRKRVFGGLVVAQALVAAARTVADRAPHSLHAYFILPGDPKLPIDYEVERVRDGRSFTTRRCAAIQAGRPIFALFASFQVPESGLDHQAAMPDVPDPDSLPSKAEIATLYPNRFPPSMKAWFDGENAIEVRSCDLARYDGTGKPNPVQYIWIRATGRLPDDPAIHRAVLAYLSDLSLLDVALAAHGRTLFQAGFSVASLDHALWFHRPFRADEWLLFAQDSPNTSGARGLARGLLFSRDGVLVASVMQEGLIRPVTRPTPPSWGGGQAGTDAS